MVYVALFVVAFLYSSVGHAGASGYIATLSLLGMQPGEFKPVVLLLNILVSVIGSIQFYRAGHFSLRLFWPFAIFSIPMAFLGGSWQLPDIYLKPFLGFILLVSSIRLIWQFNEPSSPRPPSIPLAMFVGALLGLVAGLTGTGGGIFLTPMMLFCGWAGAKRTAATSVVFILVNSIAGLLGWIQHGSTLPQEIWLYGATVIVAGALGSFLGSWKFPPSLILKLLAVVLIIAGSNLLFRL